jgi:hypothetical protein
MECQHDGHPACRYCGAATVKAWIPGRDGPAFLVKGRKHRVRPKRERRIGSIERTKHQFGTETNQEGAVTAAALAHSRPPVSLKPNPGGVSATILDQEPRQ